MDLRIRDLTKEFGDFKAVDHFSYDLRCGVYGLLGVNGAGNPDANAYYLDETHIRAN